MAIAGFASGTVWLGIPLSLLAAMILYVSVRDLTVSLRTISDRRRSDPTRFALKVQNRLHTHIGRTLQPLIRDGADLQELHRILCHRPELGYTTLTTAPRTFLREALTS